MKTIPLLLQNHLDAGTTTLAHGLKITRTDGQVYAFTSAVDDVVLGGVTYSATQGLTVSRVETSSGLEVDNLELTTLDDGTFFSHADVLGGVWRNAAFQIIRYNYASPSDGFEVVLAGTIGDVKLMNGMVSAELRGLQQYLQQPIGSVLSKTCRARLGDAFCKVNLTPFTVNGTITAVTSNQVFTDSARTEADDYFAEGILTFTSGPLNGFKQKVKTYAAKTFTLSLPMLQAITVGTTYTVVAGCRKRLMEDCKAKFNNVLNFQGEPHIPGLDRLMA